MGLFSNMKQSLAAAKDALRLAEETARNAAAGQSPYGTQSGQQHPGQQPGASIDASMGAGSTEQSMPPRWPPTSTPIPTAQAPAMPVASWATAGATIPFMSPPPPSNLNDAGSAYSSQSGVTTSAHYPGSVFGVAAAIPYGAPHAIGEQPIGSATTSSMFVQQILDASSSPPRGKRHWWPMIALVLAIAGGIMLAIGIVGLVSQNAKVRTEAIATGDVGALNEQAETYQFTIDKAQAYSVYIDLDTNDSNTRDAIVGATECTAVFQDGTTTQIRGSRQASASTIGDLSSIGYFDAPKGAAAIRCTQQPFGRRSAGRLDDRHPFYVSPGTTSSFGAIGLTIGGATLLAIAMIVAIEGFVDKHRVRVQRVARA